MGTFITFRSVMLHGAAFVLIVFLPALVMGAVTPTTLPESVEIERVLGPGEIQTFEINLNAGAFARLSVVPHIPQVRIALQDPAGKEIATRSRANARHHADTISLIVENSGRYRLIVESKWPRAGRYTARIVEHRPAIEADKNRVEAEKSFGAAKDSLKRGGQDNARAAVLALERAAMLYRRLHDDGAVADVEADIGITYCYSFGEYVSGLQHMLAAFALMQCLPDLSARGNILDYIGDAYRSLGQPRKGIPYLEAALPLKNDEIPREVGVTLRNLAMAHDEMGDQEALPQYQRLLEMMREAGEPVGVGYVNLSISDHLLNRGQWQGALEHAQQALRAWRIANFRTGEGIAAITMGTIYQARGEPERALAYYQKAMAMSLDGRISAETAFRMSNAYRAMGDIDRAIEQQEQVLKTYRERANHFMEGEVLRSLGTSYAKKGESGKALQYLSDALAISQSMNLPYMKGSILRELAAVQFELGNRKVAHQSATAAIEIFHPLHSDADEAAARLIRARIESADGNLDAARADAEASIVLTEKLRGSIGTPETRATYLASVWDTYEFYIDLLMQLHASKPGGGLDALALRASEQARARSLIDLLSESRVGTPGRAGTARLGALRSLRERISAKAQAQLKLAGKSSSEVEAIQHELEDLNAQYEQLVAQIRREDPGLAALASPEPLELARLQREVVDPRTILLEYSLGEKRSFLWVVTRDKLSSHELPSREKIESAVRAAYQTLSARGEGSDTLPGLGRMLLAPAAPELRGKRLVIVPDGALQYLPFSALPSPATGQPLVVEHEIVMLPSASAIAVLRSHPRKARNTKILAAFADPVFDRNDSRLAAKLNENPSIETSRGAEDEPVENEVERSARESGLTALQRLPFTRREANAVLSLVPPSQRKEALDFAANRREVLNPDLRQYRYVHFATHGLLNNFHPELSGIVLSMVDEKGKELDGFLSTADVFNLSLSADLVVLSGCRTGLGKEIRGEGIAGLTRAFMYAGALRVVASLWNVNDAATAELMKRFYQGMLGPDRLSPPAALRAAQLSLQEEKRWSAPYYWAAFVIQGEWN